MLYSKWSSLTMFCPLVTSLHMYFCSGCVYVFEIDVSLSEIYITSWPCVLKSVQQYWFCIVFKWNKYLWLISCLIAWWNLKIQKKLLNFDYIPMQMYTSDYFRKIFALMYTIFLIIHSEYWCKMLYISLSILGICGFIFLGFHIKESLSVKGSKCNGMKWSEIG